MHDGGFESLLKALLRYCNEKLKFIVLRASGKVEIQYFVFLCILCNSVKNLAIEKIVYAVDSLIDGVSISVYILSMLLSSPKIESSKDSFSKVCIWPIMIFKVAFGSVTFQFVIVSSSYESVELRTVSDIVYYAVFLLFT